MGKMSNLTKMCLHIKWGLAEASSPDDMKGT